MNVQPILEDPYNQNAANLGLVEPKVQPDRFAYDAVLRQRLNGIDQMGKQQNVFAAQQADKKQTDRLNAEHASLYSSQQNSLKNSYVGPQNSYGNQAIAQSKNPRSPQQAIEWAKQAAANGDTQWYRRCLAFVAQAYGLPASGTNYAIDAYTRLPNAAKHPGDMNPAVGSLVFWNTGSRAGHVALYAGNGMIYSNDISGKGKIGYVPMSDISNKWGAKYVGWANPSFAAGGG